MFKNIGTLLVLASILFFSCQNSATKKTPKDEVMDVHDEMMLQIDPIRKAQKEILAMLKDTENPLDAEKSMSYGKAYTMLENADKVMHDWMVQWKEPTEDMTEEATTQYLKDQKKKVMIMKGIMETNIKAAKEIYDF